MKSRNDATFRLLGLLGGLLLAGPNLYPPACWTQAAAFVPLLVVGLRWRPSWRELVLMGFYMGLGYSIPQMLQLLLPAPITAVLLAEQLAMIMVIVVLGPWLAGRSVLGGAIFFASLLVVTDWAGFTLLPMWGTAQSMARGWSAWPHIFWFSRLTGVTGMLFALGLLQGLAVNVALDRGRWRSAAALLGLLALLVAGGAWGIGLGRPSGRLVVAAVGWPQESSTGPADPSDPAWFQTRVVEPARSAATQGARLAVWPELAFEWGVRTRDQALAQLGDVARRNGIWMAVGYYDHSEQQNRLVFLDDRGRPAGDYAKTHLTPFEGFIPGRADLPQVEIDGLRVGGMICQDDNFTDLSRRYGQAGVDVVAVPTLDWKPVRHAHLQSSVHRAMESGCAVVRAAVNGISAIIDSDGRVVARSDHFRRSPSLICTEVQARDGITLFSRHGHWLACLCIGILLTAAVSSPGRKRLCMRTTAAYGMPLVQNSTGVDAVQFQAAEGCPNSQATGVSTAGLPKWGCRRPESS